MLRKKRLYCSLGATNSSAECNPGIFDGGNFGELTNPILGEFIIIFGFGGERSGTETLPGIGE